MDYYRAKTEEIFKELKTSPKGLSTAEAKRRLWQYGLNEIGRKKNQNPLIKLIIKFTNPLLLALVTIAILSFFFGDKISASIVLLMAILSVLWPEDEYLVACCEVFYKRLVC